jgi:uncharacterized membrane protein
VAAAAELAAVPFDLAITREDKRLQLNRSLATAGQLLVTAGLQPVEDVLAVAAFENGAKVITPFGRGYVYRFRPEDGIYEVILGTIHILYPYIYTVHNFPKY